MRKYVVSTVNAVVIAVVVWSVAGAQTSQRKSAASSSPQDPHDLSGVWLEQGFGAAQGQNHFSQWVDTTNPELTAQGKKEVAAFRPSEGPRTVMPALQNDPQSSANPPGLLRTLIYPRPFENFMTNGAVVQLFEWYHMWRQIWTDGRKVPAWDTIGPYWYGYSVGQFKGDEFQVQTVGMDNRAWMDNWGTPFSEQIQVTEHWNRVDHDTLALRLTVNDPVTYTAPWTTRQIKYKFQPKGSKDGELFEVIFAPLDEQIFNENVRDAGAYGGGKTDDAARTEK